MTTGIVRDTNVQKEIADLKMSLAIGKVEHIWSILELKYGINLALGVNEGILDVYVDCIDFGETHFIKSYSIEEAIKLDVESEANFLKLNICHLSQVREL